jgi:hypothetical protein
MTIQDLLRHTSGFLGKSLVKQAYLDAKLDDPGQTLAEVVTKISKLPLEPHGAGRRAGDGHLPKG